MEETSTSGTPFGFDPEGDWIEQAREQLREGGFTLPEEASDGQVMRAFLNVQRRQIRARPRTVHRSSEFSVDDRQLAAVEEIERRSREGADLNRFLSKRLRDPLAADGLLFDWDIHHFHLGTVLEASGFVRRTHELLFARVTQDAMYLIAVGAHGDWADERLVEIICRDWPESIGPFRLKGLRAPDGSYSQKEREQLRNAGVQTVYGAEDGSVYAAIGGGYTTDGTNTSVTVEMMRLRRYLRILQKIVAENDRAIRKDAWSVGVDPSSLRLRLMFEGDRPVAQDEGGKIRVALPAYEQIRGG